MSLRDRIDHGDFDEGTRGVACLQNGQGVLHLSVSELAGRPQNELGLGVDPVAG
jgi:hypothetical protein